MLTKLLFLSFSLALFMSNASAKQTKKLNAPYMVNTMQMVVKWNKNILIIEAAAPANSIVGFEHIAQSAKEKRDLRLKDAKLKKYPLIELGNCKLKDSFVYTDLYYVHSHQKDLTGSILPEDKDDTLHYLGDAKGRVDYLMEFKYICKSQQDLKLTTFKHFPKIKKVILRDKKLDGRIKQVLTVHKPIIYKK